MTRRLGVKSHKRSRYSPIFESNHGRIFNFLPVLTAVTVVTVGSEGGGDSFVIPVIPFLS